MSFSNYVATPPKHSEYLPRRAEELTGVQSSQKDLYQAKQTDRRWKEKEKTWEMGRGE